MDFIKRWMAQVQVTLAQLPLVTKMFIGTLCVILFASLFLVIVYAGRTEMVAVLDQPLSTSQQSSIINYLEMQDIPYKQVSNQILVPKEHVTTVLASLQTNELLPEDISEGFMKLVENQNYLKSASQNAQDYLIVQQKVLARVIEKMRGVGIATVLISRPKSSGFGRSKIRPSASVNVVMRSGKVNQNLADSITGWVAGSVAEMTAMDVVVIDANNNRQWKSSSAEDMIPSDLMEYVQKQEQVYQDKIAVVLSYIPNAIVVVNVEADMKRRKTESLKYDKEGDGSTSLIKRDSSINTENKQTGASGEPGVRSNAGAMIAGSIDNQPGNTQTSTEKDSEFSTHAGSTRTTELDPGGALTRISATVNIPRSYFVAQYMVNHKSDTKNPTDDLLKPVVNEELIRIRKQVLPQIKITNADDLVVDVYPDGALAAAEAKNTDTTGPSGMIARIFNSEGGGGYWLIGLASFSMFAMLMMMRKASQRPDIPSAQELAGIPPKLETDDGMVVGEVDESEAALAGMELDENQLRTRHLIEQVENLVKESPDEAVSLVKRWITESQ